jgi:hypothetical protein
MVMVSPAKSRSVGTRPDTSLRIFDTAARWTVGLDLSVAVRTRISVQPAIQNVFTE